MVLRRRWRLSLLVIAIVVAGSLARSLSQEASYESKASVYLSRSNVAGGLTGTDVGSIQGNDFARLAQTQAAIAGSSTVRMRALQMAGIPASEAEDFRKNSQVSSQSNADILSFSVRDGDPGRAQSLTRAYSAAYISYRRELDTAALQNASKAIRMRISEESSKERPDQNLLSSLRVNQQRLDTLEALQTANSYTVRPASNAAKVSPQPIQTGIIAAVLGLFLAAAAVALREALDTRFKDADQLSDYMGLSLLGRLAAPPKQFRETRRLVMMDAPTSVDGEVFRVLRTNIDFANVAAQARCLMVMSAVENEGKSTTIANVAVTVARAGASVALVDADLRSPTVHRFFDLPNGDGVTLVVAGKSVLSDALVGIDLDHSDRSSTRPASPGPLVGSLNVLPAGPAPPDPGLFVGSDAFRDTIAELSAAHDFVFIDTPPVLRVGDALSLSPAVGGVLLVTRLNRARRPLMHELRRILRATNTPVLGLIATDAGSELRSKYGYGYGYGYGSAAAAETMPPKR